MNYVLLKSGAFQASSASSPYPGFDDSTLKLTWEDKTGNLKSLPIENAQRSRQLRIRTEREREREREGEGPDQGFPQ